MKPLDPYLVLPAPAQGALALQCRRDDAGTRELLSKMNDAETARCVEVEREVVRALNGDCHSPIAALATVTDAGGVWLRVAVGGRDGDPPVVRAGTPLRGSPADAAVAEVMGQLASKGVRPQPPQSG
jgi:hydroxymethylbilane synthase